jgi:hypothetical protein
MLVTQRLDVLQRELGIFHLRFLQAQDVRLMALRELRDDGHAKSDRVDIPGGQAHWRDPSKSKIE